MNDARSIKGRMLMQSRWRHRSAGKKVHFDGEEHTIEELTDDRLASARYMESLGVVLSWTWSERADTGIRRRPYFH